MIVVCSLHVESSSSPCVRTAAAGRAVSRRRHEEGQAEEEELYFAHGGRCGGVWWRVWGMCHGAGRTHSSEIRFDENTFSDEE
jgi:hypothetical protein